MKRRTNRKKEINWMLPAALGIGAALLLGRKGGTKSSISPAAASEASDIPNAPKIIAVNKAATESPVPTGIVSDEEGMEAAGGSPEKDDKEAPELIRRSAGAPSSFPEDDGYNDERPAGNSPKASVKPANPMPAIISTPLTPKEKAIIDKGVLSDELALQRPDLYKAVYIRKHGRNGNARKALLAAEAAISNIQLRKATTATPAQKRNRHIAFKPHQQAAVMVRSAKSDGIKPSASAKPHAGIKSAAKHAAHAGSKALHPKSGAARHPVQRRAAPRKGAALKIHKTA